MTVASETKKSGPYTGNGVTTAFPYGFRILDASHIRVIRTEADVDTDVVTGFTVSGVGADAGGSVTFSVAPTALQKITLIRNVPLTQETDLENQGAYYAESIEAALDLSVMRDQQLQEQIDRSLKIPVGAPISGTDEAIATLLAFGAIYLGASDVAPTERADGSPLTGGELYFDTVENGLSVYTGTEWSLLAAVVNGTLSRQTYTATAGQTVFAINYDVGFVDVWLNGVKLVAGDDFTATNGTSITLTVGATLGDSVDIIAFGSFALADMLAKTANGSDILDVSAFITNLGFSAFVAGLRAIADDAAFRTAIGARGTAAITVADMAAAAVRLASEGFGSPLDTELATALWVDGAIPAKLNAGGSAPLYACRAWVNFNGTGTVAIRASGNVSSITDNGTGDYTVNFTEPMPDANYVVSAFAGNSGGANSIIQGGVGAGQTASSVRLFSLTTNSRAAIDVDTVAVAIFR